MQEPRTSVAQVNEAGRLRVMRVIARMNVGGPALQVTGLVEGLPEGRFEHTLYAGDVGPGEVDYVALRAPGLPLTRVPGLGREPDMLGDVRALAYLVREMRAFRPHIVHTHTAKAGALGRSAAVLARVPAVVHTFHGHLLHGYFPPLVTRGVVQVERGLARISTRLVAVGAQVRDDLLAAGIGNPSQYAVIPPGIALPAAPSRVEARRLLGLPADALVVTLVARLTGIKRPERFLELAVLLRTRHPDAVFALCGEGELFEQLRRQAGPNTVFLGWKADVETVHAATDVAVLTSDNEGTPVSLIEAALCGVPAVAPDVGSVSEVVLDGRSGLLASTAVSDLAEKVSRLLTDRELRGRLAAGAAEHATGSYGRARLLTDTQRLYEQIAAEKGWA